MNTETPIPVLKPNNFLTDLNIFIEYCNDFYNVKTGMYPFATKKEIINAIGEYLTQPHEFEIQFDSIDREKVREILQPSYNWMGVSGGFTLGPATEFTICEDEDTHNDIYDSKYASF